MRLRLLCLFSCLIAIGCVPPLPFQPYHQNEPNAAANLSREETRLLSLSENDVFGRITEALLHMNCRITTSDKAGNVLSFEQTKEFRFVGGSGSSIKEGTLHFKQEGSKVRCHLVLGGKLLNYPVSGYRKVQPYGRLAPEEHKQFLDELTAAL